ncbi:hypothetical protein SPHINGO8BC_70156 [Sphingobacterium multivorum]|uniref:Uncharacterized protein n=1 Tax=Sphingobacterium multivorum TaxID=28454 RepID=A0A654DW22_SPHMU|nr:hypothetical protein SPHINGO8BC_70156 [Sphingobacterium multivorum]
MAPFVNLVAAAANQNIKKWKKYWYSAPATVAAAKLQKDF